MLKLFNRGKAIDKLIKERLGKKGRKWLKGFKWLTDSYFEDSMLFGINKQLAKLHNGGYQLTYYEPDDPFVLLR